MDDIPTSTPSTAGGDGWATTVAGRWARLLRRAWWISVAPAAVLGTLAVMLSQGLLAPAGGAAVLAGLAVVAAVARNASAEAMAPGTVRPRSLLRAAGFGLLLHGGLLVAATVGGAAAPLVASWVLLGGVAVVLSRPATLAAVGAVSGGEARPQAMTTPEIVAELRMSSERVRRADCPDDLAMLVERRSRLLDEIEGRDPRVLRMLLDDDAPARRDHPGEESAAA